MKTYSQDLREKVAAAVAQDKQSNRLIAEVMGISESTIEKWYLFTAFRSDSCIAEP